MPIKKRSIRQPIPLLSGAALHFLLGLGAIFPVANAAMTYQLDFAPDSRIFEPQRAQNQDQLQRISDLLRDYHGVQGLRFALVGNVSPDCAEQVDCTMRETLKARVESVVSAMANQDGATDWLSDLHWQERIAVSAPPSSDQLELRSMKLKTPSADPRCPYELAVDEPRLPPRLETSVEPWVRVRAVSGLPLSSAARLRVIALAVPPDTPINQPRESGGISSGSTPPKPVAEWDANALPWQENGIAEITLAPIPHTRAVGDVVHSWNPSVIDPSAPGAAPCTLRLLRRP